MEFSAEQRNAATGMVIARPTLAIHQAIDLQCQLNAAVELLRQLAGSREFALYLRDSTFGRNVESLVSAFPVAEEGGSK